MSPHPDDLTGMKDDMTAFIEGHGMRRLPAYVDCDQVQAVMWKDSGNPDSWKDFVELAKAAGATFLTMDDWVLEGEELDELTERVRNAQYTNEEDIEEVRWLRAYVAKTGFIQLGWAYQGTLFLYEASTQWYERYQRIVELLDDFGGITIDESDQEDEH
jgi:hypothetical protein